MKRPRPMTSREFERLLRRRTARNAAATDRAILGRTETDLAILMCDSSGFTRRTHEEGILHFLSVLAKAYDRVLPCIDRHGGTALSHRADNILAVFPDAAAAVKAAVSMQRTLQRMSARRPRPERLKICIGIDAGRVVRLADDVFGACVNIASKLGEDTAGADEILVTAEVARRAKGAARFSYARSTEMGGRSFELYRVRY